MRCIVSNKKKLKKLSAITGLNVVSALTRGGTSHRYDLKIADGPDDYDTYSYFPTIGQIVRYSFNGQQIIEEVLNKDGSWSDQKAIEKALVLDLIEFCKERY